MLPDLPSLKAEIEALLMQYFAQQVHSKLGVFQEASHRTMHEGDRMRVVRADGVSEESNFQRASTEMSIKFEEAGLLSLEERIRMFDAMAEDMANQLVSGFFNSLNMTLDAAGQTIDGRGRPISGEVLLEFLKTLQLDFLPNGEHSKLSLVIPLGQSEAAQRALEEIDNDPALKKTHDDLLVQKKVEWRDRETARKLVG